MKMVGTHTWLLSISLALGHPANIGASREVDWMQGLCSKTFPSSKKLIQEGKNTPCPATAGDPSDLLIFLTFSDSLGADETSMLMPELLNAQIDKVASKCKSDTTFHTVVCPPVCQDSYAVPYYVLISYVNMAVFGEAQPGALFYYREDKVSVLPISITFLALMSLTKFAIS